jgi:hypothetical protein
VVSDRKIGEDIAVLRERVDRIRSDDLKDLRGDLADLRADIRTRLDIVDEKLDQNRVRTIAVLGSLVVAVLLFAADVATRF